MKSGFLIVVLCTWAVPLWAQTPRRCPIDSVKVGTVCVDKYEGSVWQIPADAKGLLRKIQTGKVELGDLVANGATQVSPGPGCAPFPATFPQNGNWTAPLYAVSVAGVPPTTCVSWLQAEQACALAGKRQITNQEWQRAAAGTPDPGATPGPADCNTSSAGPGNTGSRANCVSSWGTFDMVGNVDEWVADYADDPANCQVYGAAGMGSDRNCFGGDGTTSFPNPITRGGDWDDGTNAGVFSVGGTADGPNDQDPNLGFRCAR
jgi:formylglycine-generating enzyme required for sulfatase activity